MSDVEWMKGRVTMRLYPKPEPPERIDALFSALAELASASYTSSGERDEWRVSMADGVTLDSWSHQVAKVLKARRPANEAWEALGETKQYTPADLDHIRALIKAIDQKKITTEMAPWSPLARAYLALRDAADYVVKLHQDIPQPRF
jgi:hypothetical protein